MRIVTRICIFVILRFFQVLVGFYIDRFTWKSTNFGSDTVRLLPSDCRYTPGKFTIGVYSLRKSSYKLAYFSKVVPVRVRAGTYAFPLKGLMYLEFPISWPNQSRIEIISFQPIIVYTSFTLLRPDSTHHDFNSNFSDQILPYIEIDPFDTCPLSFSQNKISTTQFELPIRFCIDSENSASNLFITIENPSNTPLDLNLIIKEIQISDLIPPNVFPIYKIFYDIFQDISSTEVSQLDRKELGLNFHCEFTYGETDFFSFGKLLTLCDLKPNQVFWDLGCGAGKSCITAALFFPEITVKGVELLPNLCTIGKKSSETLKNIQIFEGDLRKVDFSDADIIFISSVCFLDELLNEILVKSALQKANSKLLTLKPLPENSNWQLANTYKLKMSWGRSDCFIYLKSL